MHKNCANCKKWLADQNEPYSIKGRGRCLAVVQHDSYGREEAEENAAMVAMDDSDYFAALFTKPSHYCSEWTIREVQRHDEGR